MKQSCLHIFSVFNKKLTRAQFQQKQVCLTLSHTALKLRGLHYLTASLRPLRSAVVF